MENTTGFEEWLKNVGIKKPTAEAYYLAKAAWEAAQKNNGDDSKNLELAYQVISAYSDAEKDIENEILNLDGPLGGNKLKFTKKQKIVFSRIMGYLWSIPKK